MIVQVCQELNSPVIAVELYCETCQIVIDDWRAIEHDIPVSRIATASAEHDRLYHQRTNILRVSRRGS